MSAVATTLIRPAVEARRGTRFAPRESTVAGLLIALLCAILVVIVALPLWSLLSKSVEDTNGAFVGLANFRRYFTTPTLVASLGNSVAVAALTLGNVPVINMRVIAAFAGSSYPRRLL